MIDLMRLMREHLKIVDHDYKLISKLKNSTNSKDVKEIIEVYEEATQSYDKSLFPTDLYASFSHNFFVLFFILIMFSKLAFDFFNELNLSEQATTTTALFIIYSIGAAIFGFKLVIDFFKTFSLKRKIFKLKFSGRDRDQFNHNSQKDHFLSKLTGFKKEITEKYNRLNDTDKQELDQLLFAYKFKNYHLNSIFKGEENE